MSTMSYGSSGFNAIGRYGSGDNSAVGDTVKAAVEVVPDSITSDGDGGNDKDKSKGIGDVTSGAAGDVDKQAAENKA
ncbi:hypothetical protein SKAU_G00142180 [Synaphobranchus kaupii]|uniref:Uncharacterized protein n=1 Tax=Synaphobranchus kaupii TaxID=118154 RepID=A0A9Q1J292_SYNKA|nr:hypothetical protein SKAU_G00142180 [Synaphobranchus kaupii]